MGAAAGIPVNGITSTVVGFFSERHHMWQKWAFDCATINGDAHPQRYTATEVLDETSATTYLTRWTVSDIA